MNEYREKYNKLAKNYNSLVDEFNELNSYYELEKLNNECLKKEIVRLNEIITKIRSIIR